MAQPSPTPTTAPDDFGKARERDLITIVRDLVRELRSGRGGPVEVTLSSRLDRDLGIDSLGRTELVLRLERAFAVQLPTQVIGEAETVRDLLGALGSANAAPQLAPVAEHPLPDAPPLAGQTAVSGSPSEARTLVEVLEWHVAHHPDRLHVTLLRRHARHPRDADLRGARHGARRAVAAGLIARDIVPGDRIALMLPTSLDFFVAFFGILYAGAVPVPIYPPVRLTQIEDHLRRQAGILRNAGARILVTVPEGLRLAALLRGAGGYARRGGDRGSACRATSRPPCRRSPTERRRRFIQYTSGSTGDPKGVVLSHANLLANMRSMIAALQATPADVFVSWLPLYHDMGLIGAWLGIALSRRPALRHVAAHLPGRGRRAGSGRSTAAAGRCRRRRTSPTSSASPRSTMPSSTGSTSARWRVGRQRRRAGQRRHLAPLHRAILAATASARARWRRSTGWPRTRSASRSRRSAAGR